MALPAIGTAAAGGGAGALARAGATSVRGGTVYRTFEASLTEVHAAVQASLSRLEFPEPVRQVDREHVTLRAEAIERRMRLDLQPITPALTQVGVPAVIGPGRTDLATATTVIDSVADALGARSPRSRSSRLGPPDPRRRAPRPPPEGRPRRPALTARSGP